MLYGENVLPPGTMKPFIPLLILKIFSHSRTIVGAGGNYVVSSEMLK